MRIMPLNHFNLSAFCAYCISHRLEHDESYLNPEDLAEEELLGQDEGPSFLMLANDDSVIGAASLMLKHFRPLRKGRFRILHAATPDPEHYRTLVQAVLPSARDLETVYLFLPKERAESRSILGGLGFAVTRYAFLLERPATPPVAPQLPAGFSLRPYLPLLAPTEEI